MKTRNVTDVSHLRRHRTVARQFASVWAATLLLTPLCLPIARGQSAPTEYQLKAAFLFNFAKFVDWPETSFVGPQAPFSICVVGTDPFGRVLDDTLRDKTIANRPVVVSRMKDSVAAHHCQIIFVSSSEREHVPEIFQSMRGSNALLVGEMEDFASSGGAIQFTLEDNRVRFVINPDAADRAGLQISSKLLALAHVIRDTPKNGKG